MPISASACNGGGDRITFKGLHEGNINTLVFGIIEQLCWRHTLLMIEFLLGGEQVARAQIVRLGGSRRQPSYPTDVTLQQ